MTGANGSLGRVILPRLLASDFVEKVIAFDLAKLEQTHEKLVFAPVDLTRPSADREMAEVLEDHGVSLLVHLAFFSSQIRNASYAHEVEALGTVHVLSACVEAGLSRIVMSSTTTVYGASAQNPNFLTEDRPLKGSPRSRFISDKVEAEQQVRKFRDRHRDLSTTVLRFAPIIGPNIENPFTRYLGRRIAPTLMGYDPLMQFLHEEDAAEATLLAVQQEIRGEFNIVGRGVIPLSTVLRLTGARPLPLPHPWARGALKALNATGLISMPPSFLEYVRYLWVADGRLAEQTLAFRPRYSSREAVISFASRTRHAVDHGAAAA